MDYTRLQDLRDIYPTGEENANTAFSVPDPPAISLQQAYTRTSDTSIQFRGKYPENYINFKINNIPIRVLPKYIADIQFPFIVDFAEGDSHDYWTSPRFADILEKSGNNNPYYTPDRSAIVVLHYRMLAEYYRNFKCGEDYAEVEIIRTLGLPPTDDEIKVEMLKHIDWMCGKPREDEKLRSVKEYGLWSLNITELLGRDHSDCLKEETIGTELDGFDPSQFPIIGPNGVVTFQFDNSVFRNPLTDPRSNQDYEGGRYGQDSNVELREDSPIVDVREENRSNQDFDGSPRGDSNVTVVPIEDTRSNTDYTVSPRATTSNVEIRTYDPQPLDTRSSSVMVGTYYPFTTAGTTVGERRTYGRVTYVWSGTNWVNIS